MQNIVYLNGVYCPANAAKISVFDRGFMFADGVYEVVPVYNGQLFCAQRHWQRLLGSIKGLNINTKNVASDDATFVAQLQQISQQLIEKNNLQTGAAKLYVQLTRGQAGIRQHLQQPDSPTLFISCEPTAWPQAENLSSGIHAITINEARASWQRHKTIANLHNIIGLEQARAQNAAEAIWNYDGIVLEGCHSNVFCVKDNILYTPSADLPILSGVTRNLVIELAASIGLDCKQTNIQSDDFATSAEIFVTGSTKTLLPVTKLNNKTIGSGHGGKIWRALFDAYQNLIATQLEEAMQHDTAQR